MRKKLFFLLALLAFGLVASPVLAQSSGSSATSNTAVGDVNFATLNLPVVLPYSQDFETNPESITDFAFQGTGNNQWAIGSATFNPVDASNPNETGHSLYVSTDNGASYTASNVSISYAYAVMEVEFPADPLEYHLSFDYKVPCVPVAPAYALFRVFMIDGSAPISSIDVLSDSCALTGMVSEVSDWTHADILLSSGVIGTSKKIVFCWYNYGATWLPFFTGDPAAIDNIAISGSFCGTPATLGVSDVTPSSATLSWTETGSSSEWTVSWREAGSQNSYNVETVSGTPSVDVTGLSANTSYEFFVVANCGSENSQPSETFLFTTSCDAISVTVTPWTANFEGTDADFLTCWVSASTGYRNGIIYPHIEPTPSIAHNSTSALEVAFGDIVTALPPFTEDLSTLELSFWAMTNNYSGSYSNILEIGYITNPLVASSFVPMDTLFPTLTSHTKIVLSFEELAELILPATTRIAFRFNQENSNNLTSWYLDDMQVGLIPACGAPVYNSVTVSNVTDQSADIAFVDNSPSHNAWRIYYRPADDTTAVYQTEEAYSTFGNTISSLAANTTYTVFVKTVCGGVEGETQTDPVTFTTTSIPAQLPLIEDFEDETDMQWVLLNGSQTNKWYVGTPTDTASDVNTTPEGSRGLYISTDNGASNTYGYAGYFTSSRVYAYRDILVPDGVSELLLSFDWKAYGRSQTDEFLRVYWLDPDSVTLTPGNNPSGGYDATGQPGNYGPEATEHWLSRENTWQHVEMVISANQFAGMGDGDKIYRLVFHWRDAFTYYGSPSNPPAAVDNVQLRTLDCNSPTALEVSDITDNSATVSWTGDAYSYSVIVTQGANTTYQVVYSNSVDLVGLTSSTNTTVTVRSLCGPDSSMAAFVEFYTSCGVITVSDENPWFEDFESYAGNGNMPFICWETPVHPNGPFVYCGHDLSCHSGENSAEFKGAVNMLVLPEFANDLSDLRLSFWATATPHPSTGTVAVGYMTDVTDTSTFVFVADAGVPGPRGDYGTGSGHGNFMGPFDFNGVTASSGARMALRYLNPSNTTASWNLDDFTVELAPACPSPVKNSVAVTDVDGHHATVSFVDNDPAHNSWTVYYRDVDTSNSNSWMTEATTTTSVILSNLQPETTYEVYVITDCGSVEENPDKTNTITFTTDIACPPPAGLVITEIGMTSATASWSGTADGFNIEYGELGFTFGNGTLDYSTTNSYNLTGLTSGTVYTVYVSADCGVDGFSDTVAVNFNTALCDTTDQCVYVLNLTDSYGDGWNGASVAVLQNGITVAEATIPTIGNNNTVNVPLCDGQSTTLVWNTGGYDYECSFVLLDPWGTEVYASSGTPSGTLATFNAYCTEITCLRPSEITVSNIGLSSADVSWIPVGTETDWNVEYKMSSDSVWTVVSINNTSYSLTNLAALTNYDVRVQADCGNGELSTYLATTFATVGCEASEQCAYSFVLNDVFGGGWNGSKLEVQQNGATVAMLSPTGISSTEIVNLCDSVSTSLVWHSASLYDFGAGFTLMDPTGTVVCTFAGMDNYTTYTFTTNCSGSPSITNPMVSTDPATNITQTSATINGTVTNPGNIPLTNMGFEWKSANSMMYSTVMVTDSLLAYDLYNLTPNTLYTYRAFITYGGLTYYGNDEYFSTLGDTLQPIIDPTVVTGVVSDIAQTSATLHGMIVNPDNVTITAMGFEWKATEAGNYQQIAGAGAGNDFTAVLSNLTPSTDYTYRAFITYNGATVYGDALSFTTQVDTTSQVDSTGIEARLAAHISLYPNPAKEVVNVQCTMNNVQCLGVEFFDVYGKVVRTVGLPQCDSPTTRINVAGLADGVYFVRVTTDAGVVTKRFVKR